MYKSTDSGANWLEQLVPSTSSFYSINIADANNIISVGRSGTILRYHSPANATATKLLVNLPGQSFSDGTGVYGTATSVRAGESVSATIYAVDANNILDKGNASIVGFTTTDPGDSNPANVQLTQGGTCVQSDRQAGDPECGIGTASFTFHTAGVWSVTASDTNSVLSAGTSSPITVTAASPTQLYSSSTSTSTTAGVSSGALTLGLKDTYGNGATADSMSL